MNPTRVFALAIVASLSMACAEDDDLKDTRAIDTGMSQVLEVEVPDTGALIDTADDTRDDTGGTATDTEPVPDSIVDSVAVVDSGTTTTDSGTVKVDTGTVVDTGLIVDTGTPLDTGPIADTGTPLDSGPVVDTGAPSDTGTPFDATVADTGSMFDSSFDTEPTDAGSIDSDFDTILDPDTGSMDSDFDTTLTPADTESPPVDTSDTDVGIAPAKIGAVPSSPSVKLARTHSISIDGVNDFRADEMINTTTPGVRVFVSWDANYLYLGYEGVSADRSVAMFFGSGLPGSRASDAFGTQQALLPFAADHALIVRADGGKQRVFKQWSGKAWLSLPLYVDVARAGDFLEIRVPLALLGGTPKLGLTWLVRDPIEESISAGPTVASFIDGYSPAGAPKTIARWIDVDRTSPLPPNAPSRVRE